MKAKDIVKKSITAEHIYKQIELNLSREPEIIAYCIPGYLLIDQDVISELISGGFAVKRIESSNPYDCGFVTVISWL